MGKTIQLKPETVLFVEALQSLLQTEDKIYSSLVATYGEEQGSKMWNKGEVYTLLEEAKREVKILIGDSLELSFVGALDRCETAKKEGVC